MKKGQFNERLLVLVLCFIVAVLSMLHVIIGSAKTPEGMVYLWTGHYYLDYFYYLTPIAQGTRGALVAFSQAATDDSTLFIHLWPYILIGVIARLINISPITAYWGSVFILSFILAYLTFVTIEKILNLEQFKLKLTTFLLTIFAVPFFTININKSIFHITFIDFWYSSSILFRRFTPIPHHLLTSIFILVTILLTVKFLEKLEDLSLNNVVKYGFIVGLIFSVVLSFNSFNSLVPFAALLLGIIIFILINVFKKKYKEALFLFTFSSIILLLFTATAIVLRNYYSESRFESVFKEVELNLHQNPGIWTFLLSQGILLVFALVGIPNLLKKIKPIGVILIILYILSLTLYFSPLDKFIGTHNGRFLSPLIYILLASASTLGINRIADFFGRSKNFFKIGILSFITVYFLVANIRIYQDILNDKSISSSISYLPIGIIDGFRFIDSQTSQGNVLMSPSQFLGTVLPVFVNKRVYVARPIITPEYLNKNIRTNNFYLGRMNKEEAAYFLKENNLEFVVLTSIEGYEVSKLYEYSFLKEIYKNKDIVIFKFQD